MKTAQHTNFSCAVCPILYSTSYRREIDTYTSSVLFDSSWRSFVKFLGSL